MADIEKVIRAFEQYVYNFVELTTTDEYNHQILEQVLALLKEQNGLMLALDQSNAVNGYLNAEIERLNVLLKEQEAVEPIPPEDEFGLYKCGKCHHQLFRCVDKYCSRCGKAVKWE